MPGTIQSDLMNDKWLRRMAVGLGVVALAGLLLVKLNGQQNNRPGATPVTTNWVGSLVVGKEDVIDRLAPGPHPQCESQVQLGLRSDGVVVWRRVP